MTWVIAHRGASADERENTLPAFERAIELGADFVELDVQASADGELVVFHDLDLDRLTPLRGPLRRQDGRRAPRARDPDARGGARPDARPNRRDGGAEERAPLPPSRRGRPHRRAPRRRRRRPLVRPAHPSRGTPSTPVAPRPPARRATASRSALRRATPGLSASTTRASRHGGSSARAASGSRRRSTRSTTSDGCDGSSRWASTGSSATGPRSCARSSALRLGLQLQLLGIETPRG